mmetsp:Transcript_11286/g.15980  ORF Transcript_11286/g.15980 Transcript_11286/m.15980 type:complete len:260 (-) Transcript_11286:10-789(-)
MAFELNDAKPLRKDAEVLAYFKNTSLPENLKGVLRVNTRFDDDSAPILGMEAGWVRGLLLQDVATDDPEQQVQVKLDDTFYDPNTKSYHHSLTVAVDPSSLCTQENKVQTLLAVVCFRGEMSSAEDAFNKQFLYGGEGGPSAIIPKRFEVFTMLLRNQKDVHTILARRHLDVLPTISTFRSRVGCYFIHPTGALDSQKPGNVLAQDLFDIQAHYERDMQTLWPVSGPVYEQVVSGSWAPQTCLHSEGKVPVTTQVNYAC